MSKEQLATFAALSAALDAARARTNQDDDFEVINEPEVFAAFEQLDESAVCDDAFTVATSPASAAVFEEMKGIDFSASSARHFACGVCLFAALRARGAF